jgi:hypothetical protein
MKFEARTSIETKMYTLVHCGSETSSQQRSSPNPKDLLVGEILGIHLAIQPPVDYPNADFSKIRI